MVAPIAGVASSITPVGGISAPAATNAPRFDVASGLQQVADLQTQADDLGVKVATGDLQDIHQFMAASAKANLAMELTVAVRDKAVEAYQEIMRMQV